MEREPVDFVLGDDPVAADVDEELAQPPQRVPSGRLPWIAAGLAAVVLVGVVAANRGGNGDPRAGAAPSATVSYSVAPAPGATAIFTPQPQVGGRGEPIRLPEGNRRPREPEGCPADAAECYADTSVPLGVLTALRADFPSAQLTAAYSVLANRTDRFQPDLVSRRLHARAGSIDLTVSVRKPQHGDEDGYRRERTGPMLLHSAATHVGAAFTVTIEVTQYGPKHTPSRRTLQRLAGEPDLVAPQ